MKFYVGITDSDWFNHLKSIQPDEVNFWRPLATTNFRAIEPGAPFLFKLHHPDNYIVGGGFYSGFTVIPVSMAWEAFGEKNGVADLQTLQARIRKYKGKSGATSPDPEIGCVILSNPFFFDRQDWIPSPVDWSKNIVQGKTYSDIDIVGSELWLQVKARIETESLYSGLNVARIPLHHERLVLGKKYLQTARLGQGAFRLMTLDNYEKRCCITGESTLPVLEAAHIKPVALGGQHELQNGLVLRADMHILYDKGLIGVDPDFRIHVSSQIRDQYLNGKVYYAHDGREIALPSSAELRPDRDTLDWHMQEVFVA